MGDSKEKKDCEKKNDPENQEVNIYREPPFRYLGYLGHMGWLCQNFLPYPLLSTMGTLAYVCADAMHVSSAAAARGESRAEIRNTTATAFLWHLLATVSLPGIFLVGVHRIAHEMLPASSRCRPRGSLLQCILTSWTIPFIAGPIDEMVDRFMDANTMKTKGVQTICKELTIEEDGDQGCSSELEVKPKSSSKWFFRQSRDQGDLELERHKAKSGMQSIGIQVGRSKVQLDTSQSRSQYVQTDQSSSAQQKEGKLQPESSRSQYVQVDKTTVPQNEKELEAKPDIKPAIKIEIKTEPEFSRSQSVQVDKTMLAPRNKEPEKKPEDKPEEKPKPEP